MTDEVKPTETAPAAVPPTAMRRPSVRRSWIVALVLLCVVLAGSQLWAYWSANTTYQDDSASVPKEATATSPTHSPSTVNVQSSKPPEPVAFGPSFSSPAQTDHWGASSTAFASTAQEPPERRTAASEFDNEQRAFEAEIRSLRQRISKLEAKLKRRAQNRDRLIDRKMKQKQQLRKNQPDRAAIPVKPLGGDSNFAPVNPPTNNLTPDSAPLPPLMEPDDPIGGTESFPAVDPSPRVAPSAEAFGPSGDDPIPVESKEFGVLEPQPSQPTRRSVPLDRPFEDFQPSDRNPDSFDRPKRAAAPTLQNAAWISQLQARFAELQRKLADVDATAKPSLVAPLELEQTTVCRLMAVQIQKIEASLIQPRQQLQKIDEAIRQLKNAGIADSTVAGLQQSRTQLQQRCLAIQKQIATVKAPFFDRTISVPTGEVPLKDLAKQLTDQTNITFRLGVPSSDELQSISIYEGFGSPGLPGDNSQLSAPLEQVLTKYFSPAKLTHRFEINPKTGQLICVIVRAEFKFDKTSLGDVLMVLAQAMGVGYAAEGVDLQQQVTGDWGTDPRRAIAEVVKSLGLKHRVKAEPGGESFVIHTNATDQPPAGTEIADDPLDFEEAVELPEDE